MAIKLMYSAVALLVLCKLSETTIVKNTSLPSNNEISKSSPESSTQPSFITVNQLDPKLSAGTVKGENQTTTVANEWSSASDGNTKSPQHILKKSFGIRVPSNTYYVKPTIVLEYKPTRPSYLAGPVTIGQLIPPGTPWPDSPAGYQTTLKPTKWTLAQAIPPKSTANDQGTTLQQHSANTVLEYKPVRPSYLPEPVTIGQLIPSGTPWPNSSASYQPTLKPNKQSPAQPIPPGTTPNGQSTTLQQSTASTVLEYKPVRPSHLPDPVTIGQLVPSRTPWPNSPTGYQTTLKSDKQTPAQALPSGTTPNHQDTTLKQSAANTVLEYKPVRPSYLPDPVTISQLIPSGTPWPNSPAGYQTTLKPDKQSPAQAIPPGTTPNDKGTTLQQSSSTTVLVLGYKPTRPWYLPEPITIGQLIPPGTPWPDSPAGYQTTIVPDKRILAQATAPDQHQQSMPVRKQTKNDSSGTLNN